MSFFRTILSEMTSLILALVLAIIIWTVAVRANDPITSKSLELPIEQTGLLPSEGEVTLAERTTRISIEGPESVLQSLTAVDFLAAIDRNQVAFGDSEVDVVVTHDIAQVQVVFQEPRRVRVTAEQVIDKELIVNVQVRGDVARGHTMGEPVSDPPAIIVKGPASRVNPLTEATVSLFIDGGREDIVQVRRPLFQNSDGRSASVNGLELDTEEVVITIPVQEIEGVAEKLITVDWSGTPAPGYRLLNVDVQPATALITGSPILLEQTRTINTELIDISGLTSSLLEEPVVLILPPGIELEEIQPVVVNLEIEPIRTVSVIRRTPEIRALGEGLRANISPDQVTLTLFGPLPVLDSLNNEDVTVTLDLLELGVGTHAVEPLVNILASDIEVRSIQPDLVTVVITNAPEAGEANNLLVKRSMNEEGQ